MNIYVSKLWYQGAVCWLNETNCKLDMFLDKERSLYQAFGLTRSLSKVYTTESIWNRNILWLGNLRFDCSFQVWSMPMIHIYAEKVVKAIWFPQTSDGCGFDFLKQVGCGFCNDIQDCWWWNLPRVKTRRRRPFTNGWRFHSQQVRINMVMRVKIQYYGLKWSCATAFFGYEG